MKATLLAKGGLTDQGEYALEEGKAYLVGRSREANVIVKDKLASRNHCKISSTAPEEWVVADLGSSNGTYVNRQRITTRALRHGDVIQIGKAVLEFRVLSATTAPTMVTPSGMPAPPARPTPPPAPAQAPTRPASGPTPPARPAAGPPAPPVPSPAPHPQAQTPRPQLKPKDEPVDEDIRGLFEFLDKVDQADKTSRADTPAAGPGDLPGREAGIPTPRPAALPQAPPVEPRQAAGPAPLAFVEEKPPARPLPPKHEPPPAPPPAPPPPPAEEQGGLLAFLRKKKQQP